MALEQYKLGLRERREMALEKYKLDFSVGHTTVMEMAKPLIESWDAPMEDGCFSSFFAGRDLQDLANIARRYANYSESPIPMFPYQKNR